MNPFFSVKLRFFGNGEGIYDARIIAIDYGGPQEPEPENRCEAIA